MRAGYETSLKVFEAHKIDLFLWFCPTQNWMLHNTNSSNKGVSLSISLHCPPNKLRTAYPHGPWVTRSSTSWHMSKTFAAPAEPSQRCWRRRKRCQGFCSLMRVLGSRKSISIPQHWWENAWHDTRLQRTIIRLLPSKKNRQILAPPALTDQCLTLRQATQDGSIVAWGDPATGGTGAPRAAPTEAMPVPKVLRLAGNSMAFAAVRQDDTVCSWGQPEPRGLVWTTKRLTVTLPGSHMDVEENGPLEDIQGQVPTSMLVPG